MSVQERRHLQVAVAVLLHEARRLCDIFGLEPHESAALLKEGRAKAQARLFARAAHPSGRDHYARKIAHLLYVANTKAA